MWLVALLKQLLINTLLPFSAKQLNLLSVTVRESLILAETGKLKLTCVGVGLNSLSCSSNHPDKALLGRPTLDLHLRGHFIHKCKPVLSARRGNM